MEYKYGNKVEVIDGFYKGQVGWLEEESSTWTIGGFTYKYMVKINNSTFPFIPKEHLKVIKE